jgi:hypothetical protein
MHMLDSCRRICVQVRTATRSSSTWRCIQFCAQMCVLHQHAAASRVHCASAITMCHHMHFTVKTKHALCVHHTPATSAYAPITRCSCFVRLSWLLRIGMSCPWLVTVSQTCLQGSRKTPVEPHQAAAGQLQRAPSACPGERRAIC